MNEIYPSALFEKVVNEFAKLPGIGVKTAMRLVLYLLRRPSEEVQCFGEAIIEMRSKIIRCHICHNISDSVTCPICCDAHRDHTTICVVEDIQDVMAIERTGTYKGVYHVLGGVISPVDGIGPSDIEIESLVSRALKGDLKEIILALNPTMEGDTTNFYIYRKICSATENKQNNSNTKKLKISVIARGVAQNDELQYTDEVTLGRSIADRKTFGSEI